MMRPLAVLLAAATTLTAVSAGAAATPPSVTEFRLHRPASGPQQGTITAVARVALAGSVTRRESLRPDGTPRRLRGVLTLRGGGSTLSATDTVRLARTAHRGGTALLHFRVPRSRAADLPRNSRLRAQLDVGIGSGPLRRAVPARQEADLPIGLACLFGFCDPDPGPAPNAPVAFAGADWTTTADACLAFDGPGYAGPSVQAADIRGPSGWWITMDGESVTTEVAPDGAFAFSGFAQGPPPQFMQIAPVQITGAFPGASTKPERGTVGYAGGVIGGLAQQVTLATTTAQVVNC